jgi:hypothetical protein
MLSRSSFSLLTTLATICVATASCSDVTGPRADMASLAGTYWAGQPGPTSGIVVGTFTTAENGVTTNMLQSGAQIRQRLP